MDIENSNKFVKYPKKLRSSNVSLEKPFRGSEENLPKPHRIVMAEGIYDPNFEIQSSSFKARSLHREKEINL